MRDWVRGEDMSGEAYTGRYYYTVAVPMLAPVAFIHVFCSWLTLSFFRNAVNTWPVWSGVRP